jgi:hypothetical protein
MAAYGRWLAHKTTSKQIVAGCRQNRIKSQTKRCFSAEHEASCADLLAKKFSGGVI